MTTRTRVGTALVTLLLSVVVLSPGHAQESVFRASAEAVSINVAVLRGNRPVTDLVELDFAVFDNGVRQDVAALLYQKLPIDVTVLVDVSGSVTPAVLDQLRRSMIELRRSLRPGDRMQVLGFNYQVRRLVGFDDPATAIDSAFDNVVSGGASAVRDALAVALSTAGTAERRRFVVLFSDGLDNLSITTPSHLLELVRRSTPTISVVLAAPDCQPTGGLYADLTTETGGMLVSLRPSDTLGGALRQSLDRFRSSYVVLYRPTGVEPGGRHIVDVRVSRANVEVKARKTYQQ